MQEIVLALGLALFVWAGYRAKNSDKLWYDDIERHRRGEDD